MTAELHTPGSREAFVAQAVERIETAARQAVAERGSFSLALSGGSTPRPVYEALAARARFPWARTNVFLGDERCVPADDPRSNWRMIREALLERLRPGDRPASVWPMDGSEAPAQAAESLSRAMARFFALGPGQYPELDLILLGLGPDGHTASLFPGSPALVSMGIVTHTPPAPLDPPVERLTLTLPVLGAARQVLFLAGPDKLPLVRDILAGNRPELPAAMVRPAAGGPVWLVQAPAA